MSLFTIDISPLLSRPVGSVEEFHFEQDVPEDTWDDLSCAEPLSMDIKLIRQEYGINCLILDMKTSISIPSEELEHVEIFLENISREFHLKKRNEDTDDIEYIDAHDATIDLTRVIGQELLIAGL
jgi:hypothetical protein